MLCLKCEPRIVRLNSPTLDTTKLRAGRHLTVHTRGTHTYLVPSSVQLMNCADFGSLIILRE